MNVSVLHNECSLYDHGDLLYDAEEYYDDDLVKAPRCGHKDINTCKICLSAYGKLKRSVKSLNGLKLAHINVRSLYPKIDEIRFLLTEMSIDVLCISEAWLDETISDSQIKVDGYIIERNDRNRHGGGVALYIKEDIDYQLRNDLDCDTECLWIQCKLASDTSILLCNLYRPPSADMTYYNDILNMVEKASSENKEIVILGDLNFNYKIDESLCTNPIYYLENLYLMSQIIDKPTRVTDRSSTLIDVILTTMPEKHKSTEVFKISLSDHFLIFTCIDVKLDRMKHKTIRFRCYKNFDRDLFMNDLRQSRVTVQNLSKYSDIVTNWVQWKTEFLRICDLHAPIRVQRVKNRYNPWITHDIIKMMYERDYIKDKAAKTKSKLLDIQYRRLRNNVTESICNSKKQYFDKIVDKHKNDTRKLWKELSKVTGNKRADSQVPTSITSNMFNDYFSTIGSNVAKSISTNKKWKWKNPKPLYKFNFKHVENKYVYEQLNKLDADSHLDVLDMDSKLLRLSSHVIAPSITFLINQSIDTCILPDDWKFARVTPVYKGKGSKTDQSNYRPISVLSYISCILEKEVQCQIMEYFIKHNFISMDQFAFLKNHSTATCLHRVVDDWYEAINESEMIGVCFLDIQKCFDTIDHDLLLTKLEKYGILDNELKWFKHYMSHRSQIVTCNGQVSDKRYIDIGVPQGSTLGPFLFLIFINDLSQCVPNGYCSMFADDVAIYTTGKNINDVQDSLQNCVTNVNDWYDYNKLSVNTKKSNVMLIGSQRSIRSNAVKLDINMSGNSLEQVSSTRYLGVHIDNMMKWDIHVQNICRNVSAKLATLNRVRKFLAKDVLTRIYCTSILPILDYACSVWGNCSDFNKNMIFRLQKRAARIVTGNFDYINTRGYDLMQELKWQTFHERRNYFISSLMFKCIHGNAPFWLSNEVLMACESHDRETRLSCGMDVQIPKPNRESFRNSFQYQGANLWNSLPSHLKEATTINQFKRNYKKEYF